LPNYSSIETQYLIYNDYERDFLPLGAWVLFIVSFICFIAFWSKMSNCKRILTSINNGINDHYKNNLNRDEIHQSNNIKDKTCLKCGVDSPIEHKFCAECGSSNFISNTDMMRKERGVKQDVLKLKRLFLEGNITEKEFIEKKNVLLSDSYGKSVIKDLNDNKKVEISMNEKECLNCKFIINKDNKKCEFCDYDFELKQVNIVNKDSYSDGKSRKKIFIFTVIMLFILFVTWFIGYYNQNKNIDNNEIVNEAEIDEKPLNSSTQTEEVNINQSTCANCGNLFTGFGYMMISEGNCVPCTEENSVDCEFCSEACGIENDKKSLEQYNKILNENGYNSLNENEENDYQSNTNCSFNSGGDVLAYLIGKTFRQKGGSISIRFSTDGAIISGSEQYQWITYKSLGGQKGYVKLASINPSHPDGTIQLWVSCRDNAVTDGETVLLYD
jgi:RNA polymerase subunit RPABC4/transcription elongation factor Spt4